MTALKVVEGQNDTLLMVSLSSKGIAVIRASKEKQSAEITGKVGFTPLKEIWTDMEAPDLCIIEEIITR